MFQSDTLEQGIRFPSSCQLSYISIKQTKTSSPDYYDL